MIVTDKTIQAEALCDSFKIGVKKDLMYQKMAKNVLKNRGRALDIRANVATAAASRNHKNVLSTMPEVSNFYHTGNGLYLNNLVDIMLYKWNKKQLNCAHQHHLKLKKNI